ncbi:porin family protein [Dysgonomonas sp. 520]|uniref:porin family protein n=1 Tax=Dysgonomonas sp. 520 TaxID=2302931 RepID=UPI0013D5BF55|nr:porin family protein [Dysgonomonas sp. 520]NDW10549.1 PorT family protein [Dysgonomonas sp. 520]
MKKSFFYILAALFLVALVPQKAHSQINWGIKGGVDLVDHKISTDMLNVKNRLGYNIGLTLEILPFNGLGLETGLLYGHKEYSTKEKEASKIDVSDYDYITIPLNLKKRFSLLGPIDLYALGGVYGEVKLGGGNVISDTFKKFKSKGFQMGLNLGAGVQLFKHLDVGLNFRYKLTDNYSEDQPDLKDLLDSHQKTWYMTAAYYF